MAVKRWLVGGSFLHLCTSGTGEGHPDMHTPSMFNWPCFLEAMKVSLGDH